jgi:hypothetical protein
MPVFGEADAVVEEETEEDEEVVRWKGSVS